MKGLSPQAPPRGSGPRATLPQQLTRFCPLASAVPQQSHSSALVSTTHWEDLTLLLCPLCPVSSEELATCALVPTPPARTTWCKLLSHFLPSKHTIADRSISVFLEEKLLSTLHTSAMTVPTYTAADDTESHVSSDTATQNVCQLFFFNVWRK